MDVIGQRPVVEGVRTLHQHRLVTVAKQAAPCLVPDVVASGDGVLQPAHASHQIGLGRLYKEVVVVSHQHPGVHPPAGHRASLRQGGEEKPAVVVVVVVENRLPPVAARHHVVIGTGEFNTETPWHERSVRERGFLSSFAP